MNFIRTIKWDYSFVILIVTFLALLVAAGIRSAPGVLIVSLEQNFGWSRIAITIAIAINLLLYGLCGPFLAALSERYGLKQIMIVALAMLAAGTYLSKYMVDSWHMILLWGLVVGVGTGFTSQVLGSLVANLWFVEHRGLVMGLFSASSATGQLIFLPLFSYLLVMNGWKSVVAVTALSAFAVSVLVTLFMRDKPTLQDSKEDALTMTLEGLKIGLASKTFWLLAGSFFVCGASANGLIGTHFIPACHDYNIAEVSAAGLLSVMGVFDIIGTVLSGWLSDHFDNRWLLFWYYGLRGISLVLLPSVLGISDIGLIAFTIFYGLDWVATVPPTVRLCTDYFYRHAGVVFGWLFTAHQIGAAVATFGGGTLHTIVGNYHIAFIVAGLFCLAASLAVLGLSKTKTLA